MCGWPLLGPPVRIAAALIRLPDWRDYTDHLRQQQQAALSQQLSALARQMSALERRLGELDERHLALETRSLPALTQTLEARQQDFEHRQRALVTATLTEAHHDGQDNLLKSVPAALRKLAFKLHGLQRQQRDTQATADYLLGRTEFVRRELMYEMRYGAGQAATSAAPQVIAADKLAAARLRGVKLNLGCGHLPREGYLNVDRRPMPGVDLVAEAEALPFRAGEVREISSAHLLEHFPQEQLRRQLLPYFYTLLEDGGRLHAVVPDAEAMVGAYAGGDYPYDDLREVLYGAQDYDGDFHFNMFTPASLTALLEQAGFVEVAVLESARRNGRCYEFEISATKPVAR
jgi:predicted SAM-dependent methyltransferase